MKREKVSAYLTFTLILLAVLASLGVFNVHGIMDRQPGVQPGDWFKYKRTYANLDTNLPDAQFPPDFIKIAAANYTTIIVQEVNGKNVTYTMVFEYPNGTIDEETRVVNVETGEGNGSMPIIAKNLKLGDPIYIDNEWNITGCYPRVVLKNCRETVSCYVSESDVEHYGLTGWEETWIIWDRRKGALTSFEWTTQLGNATHHYYAGLHIEIIETNCWYLRKPGVFSGDWTKYSNFQLLTDSNFPVDWSEIIPDLLFFNETEWMLNEIENINDTILNFTQTFHYKNGTERIINCTTDIVCGGEDGGDPLFLARYLNVSDVACAEILEWFIPYINYTAKMEILGILREVCVSNSSFTYTEEGETISGNGYFMWDRATGVFVKGNMSLRWENATHYIEFSTSMSLNDTNLWGTHMHTVEVDNQEFQVTTCSNTTIMNVTVNKGEKALIFNVRGYGKSGFCNVTIPKSMMWGENWEIYIDGIPLSEEYYSITEDSENIYIHIEYPLSSHEIKIVSENIVPEFNVTFLSLSIMLLTSLIMAIQKRRRQ